MGSLFTTYLFNINPEGNDWNQYLSFQGLFKHIAMVFVVEAHKCKQNGPKMGDKTGLKNKHDLPKSQMKVFWQMSLYKYFWMCMNVNCDGFLR